MCLVNLIMYVYKLFIVINLYKEDNRRGKSVNKREGNENPNGTCKIKYK